MRRHLIRLGALGGLGLIVVLGVMTARIWDQGARDERRPVDAIVVLGAAQYNGRPSNIFAARLEHALELYEAGVAPVVVLTGGKAEGDVTTEAATGRAYLLARGVPEAALLAEDQGRTTLQSLGNVARLMRAEDLRTGLFVSDRTHMLRVLRIATDHGIEAYGSPTTTSPIDSNAIWQVEATVHELAALGLYFLGGGDLVAEDLPADG